TGPCPEAERDERPTRSARSLEPRPTDERPLALSRAPREHVGGSRDAPAIRTSARKPRLPAARLSDGTAPWRAHANTIGDACCRAPALEFHHARHRRARQARV